MCGVTKKYFMNIILILVHVVCVFFLNCMKNLNLFIGVNRNVTITFDVNKKLIDIHNPDVIDSKLQCYLRVAIRKVYLVVTRKRLNERGQ